MDDIRLDNGQIVYRSIDRIEYSETEETFGIRISARFLDKTAEYCIDRSYNNVGDITHLKQCIRQQLRKNLLEQIQDEITPDMRSNSFAIIY